MSESIDSAKLRYTKAAHAMQSAVLLQLRRDLSHLNLPEEVFQRLKDLRVGINSAMSDQGGLAVLLVSKGLITEAEYISAMADAMENELALRAKDVGFKPENFR